MSGAGWAKAAADSEGDNASKMKMVMADTVLFKTLDLEKLILDLKIILNNYYTCT